jgi:hypothetical protein
VVHPAAARGPRLKSGSDFFLRSKSMTFVTTQPETLSMAGGIASCAAAASANPVAAG